MDFFDKENIKDVRLRTFFQRVTEDRIIYSEGAWSISFLNLGDGTVILKDSGDNEFPIAAGFPYEFNKFILVGHPGIVRDDIIKVVFDPADENKDLRIQFDRFVKKGDDQKFPGQ